MYRQYFSIIFNKKSAHYTQWNTENIKKTKKTYATVIGVFTDDNVLKLANENYPEQVQQSKESRWDQYFIEEQQTL